MESFSTFTERLPPPNASLQDRALKGELDTDRSEGRESGNLWWLTKNAGNPICITAKSEAFGSFFFVEYIPSTNLEHRNEKWYSNMASIVITDEFGHWLWNIILYPLFTCQSKCLDFRILF